MRWFGYLGLFLITTSVIVFSLLLWQYLEYQQVLDENERRAEECYATSTGYARSMCGYGAAQTDAVFAREQTALYLPLVGTIIVIAMGVALFIIDYKQPSWLNTMRVKLRRQ